MRSIARTQKKSAWKILVPVLLSMTLAASPAMADDDDDDDDRRDKWRQGYGHNDRDWDRDDRKEWRDDRKRWERQQRERYQRERQWQREQAHRYEQQRRWQLEQQRRYNSAYYNNNSRYNSGYYPRTVVRYAGPPAWARGRDYRSYGYNNVYQVPYNDYDRYGLYQPGYGQQWLRDDGGNYLLIAAATGIISSILGR